MTNETSASVRPGEPAPVRLMNTIWADTAGIHDDLTTPSALHDWLVAVDRRYATDAWEVPGPDELAEAKLLRDSLRRLGAFATDDPRPAAQSPVDSVDDAAGAVNRAVTHLPHPQLVVRGGRLHRDRPARTSPTRVALAELAHDAIDIFTGPGARQLRACQAPGCVFYFVRSNPRREWCSQTCGNRARAARHYRRIRTADERTEAIQFSPLGTIWSKISVPRVVDPHIRTLHKVACARTPRWQCRFPRGCQQQQQHKRKPLSHYRFRLVLDR